MLSLAVPFVALFGGEVLPVQSASAETLQGNWNISAPLGIQTFDYGSYPNVDGDYFRNVVIANCHSHNDYWRDVPLFTGLSYGCPSTEADVWLINGELLVGHDVASLRPDRTFASLYIDPLVQLLDQKNPRNEYVSYIADHYGHREANGVFDTNAGQTLQLLVDVKTPGQETWPHVVEALEPLRSRGYLSYVNASDTAVNYRAVTVIGTGDTPLDYLLARPDRDYFFDAPLDNLNSTFIPSLSPLASTSFKTAVGWTGILPATDSQLASMKALVDTAHSQDLLVRLWDNPTWPQFARNRVWNAMLELGVDFLNADDLSAVTSL